MVIKIYQDEHVWDLATLSFRYQFVKANSAILRRDWQERNQASGTLDGPSWKLLGGINAATLCYHLETQGAERCWDVLEGKTPGTTPPLARSAQPMAQTTWSHPRACCCSSPCSPCRQDPALQGPMVQGNHSCPKCLHTLRLHLIVKHAFEGS